MIIKEFIELTIKELDDDLFLEIKERIVGEYISFSFIANERVEREIFAEKIYDYFEKLEIKTKKTFENILQSYMDSWDDLVSRRIAKTPSTKKNEPSAPVPRARKYYEKVQEIKKSRKFTERQIVDYTRISMCLYSSIIEANYKEISDLIYSTKCLDIDKMIDSMKKEKPFRILLGKKTLFDLTELYSEDTAMFILSMMLYFYIKNNEIKGEY